MKTDEAEIIREIDKGSFRRNLRRFTWQAYNLLPRTERPNILDLGCGDGAATIELAVLSGGRVTAVDRDRAALARLKLKAAALDLAGRIKAVPGDLSRFKARPGEYDVVWCEGAVGAVGFNRALTLWRPFLRPGGHLVIHDESKGYRQNLEAVPGLGFGVVTHFLVPVDAWLTDYFRPLGRRLHELAAKYRDRPDALEVLGREEAEIEVFHSRPDDFATVFYILKPSGAPRIGRE